MAYIFAVFCAVFAFAAPAWADAPQQANPAQVASIRAGHRDCPHCVLVGADLDNTCVKKGDLTGADFDHANLTLMCMSYANFTDASFRGTDLSGANLAHADLAGADFTGANLNITSFKGTDLTKAKGLTQTQLNKACGDKGTKPPAGMKVPVCR